MKNHTHAIGKPFAFAPKAEAADILETVEKAHHYIEQFRVSDPDGSYWLDSPDAAIDLGFENGAAGISYFYLELYKTTKNNDYLRIAQEGFRYINRHWRELLLNKNPDIKYFELNINSGVGSIASTLLAYYEETKDPESLAVLSEIGKVFADAAEQDNGNVSWTGLPYYALGDSGIALILLKLAVLLDDEKLRALAVAAAKTLIKSQNSNSRGGKAWDLKPFGYPHSFPNFVIGTSGIGYVMAVFYEHTQEVDFLDSAKSAADYLNAISIPVKEGSLVPLMDDPEDRTFYLGACHGAGGTSKVFYQLFRLTGDERYKHAIEEMSKGILSFGAPEIQSSGYWNNTCICCGTAAILQLQIALFAAFGDQHYLDVANRCAQVLLGEADAVGNDALAWPLAETRLEPDTITFSKGYQHGAAGIASTLLQIYQLRDNGTFHWNRLSDDPYPSALTLTK